MNKVTMVDVARQAGVSQTTVSLVLSGNSRIAIPESTRRRVMDVANEMGYVRRIRPMRIRSGSRGVIGLMVPSLNSPFHMNTLRYVEQFAWRAGYEVIVSNIERQGEREASRLKSLVDKRVNGLIMAYTPRDIEGLRATARTLPVVILGEVATDSGILTIGFNGHRCGELAISHLYELKHRGVAMLTAPICNVSLTRSRRIEGARAFLAARDAAQGLFVIEDDREEVEGDEIFEFEMGYRLARRLLKQSRRFTAVIVNDMCAPGVYAMLSQAGLNVPGDVSVLGIDNMFVGCMMTPALTSIDHHLRERCKQAVDRLVERMIQPNLVNDGYLVEYSPSLIVRASTAPAPE